MKALPVLGLAAAVGLLGVTAGYAPEATGAPTRTEYTRLTTVSGWGGFDVGQSRPSAALTR